MLSAGDRVGNYQIMGLAGVGGMGMVYRALDVKLERPVALKFLPDELVASKADKERFLREARTASSLDHPNIGVIHGIEETSDGCTYIVMAFYEGETLGRKISRGPLSLGEAVDIAIQTARGLVAAHSRAVIHRDIKPGNIILAQQNVTKIVDFGLARVNISAGSTQTLGTSGTIGYMSPEQTLGKPVDQRTDIWALGVVIAEMITGRNPFRRESPRQRLLRFLMKLQSCPMKSHWISSALFTAPSPKTLPLATAVPAKCSRILKHSATIWNQAPRNRAFRLPRMTSHSVKPSSTPPGRCGPLPPPVLKIPSGGWVASPPRQFSWYCSR